MPVTTFSTTTADGELDATLHTPEGSGPWPAVIVFPDAGGPRAAISAIADAIAADGYAAVVPNVYYRAGDYEPFDFATAFTDEGERKRLFALMGALTNDRVVADADALIAAVLARPEVAGDKVGTTGYCMGGRISMLVAGALPDKVAAAASFHGGRIAVEGDANSPHLLADKVQAKVFVGGAKGDGGFTEEQKALLEKALSDAGVDHTVEIWDAHHGFAVKDNPTYDEAAEAKHYQAMHDLFGSTLKA